MQELHANAQPLKVSTTLQRCRRRVEAYLSCPGCGSIAATEAAPFTHGRQARRAAAPKSWQGSKGSNQKNQLPKEQVAHKHAARDLSWSNTSARHALEGQAKHGWHAVGPCHDPNLYGNYPALLAALQRRMQRTLPFGNAPLAASQRGTDQPSCASW